ALEQMVLGLRDDTLPPFELREAVDDTPDQEVDLITYMIRRNWDELFVRFPDPGKDDRIGVLRTLLSSINTFTTSSSTSRGYLSYIAGFLRQAGLVEEEDDDGPVDPLTEAGEAWVLDGDPSARSEFMRLAQQMITAGQGMRVAEIAQELMGQTSGPALR